MCLRTPKIINISWGSMPPDPPRVNDCRVAMFSTSANDIAPPDGKGYLRSCKLYIQLCIVIAFVAGINQTGRRSNHGCFVFLFFCICSTRMAKSLGESYFLAASMKGHHSSHYQPSYVPLAITCMIVLRLLNIW